MVHQACHQHHFLSPEAASFKLYFLLLLYVWEANTTRASVTLCAKGMTSKSLILQRCSTQEGMSQYE